MDLGVYNDYIDPISNYTSWLVYVALFLVIITTAILIVLLKRKEKPWKLYSIILIEYVFLLVVFFMTGHYFNTYTGTTETAGIRAINDLLNISSILQYAAFIILGIRILGADLSKFNFNTDEEYLEMSSEDREEFEVQIEFDKESIKRKYNKLKRSLHYFYVEHRFIMNSLFVALFVALAGYSFYYFQVVNKVYKESSTFVANQYSIKINRSYYTDTNYRGEPLGKDSGYVIVDMTVTNLANTSIEMNLDRFHLMSGNSRSTYTVTQNTNFSDFGNLYAKRTLKSNKPTTFKLVFRVDKNKKNNNYVLFYQEIKSAFETNLKKVRLNPIDLTKIEDQEPVKINEQMTVKFASGKEKSVTILEYQILDQAEYTYYTCPRDGCHIATGLLTVPPGFKILKINFISPDFDGKGFVDFSNKYGIIKLIERDGSDKSVKFSNIAGNDFTGNEMFVKVPDTVLDSKILELVYQVRNKKYTYVLR